METAAGRVLIGDEEGNREGGEEGLVDISCGVEARPVSHLNLLLPWWRYFVLVGMCVN